MRAAAETVAAIAAEWRRCRPAFRRLEALLNSPAAARDADQFVECGALAELLARVRQEVSERDLTCRPWLGPWFRCGGDLAASRQLDRLDRDREALLAVPEDERDDRAGDLAATWAVRLQDAVDDDPDAGRELRAYVKRWRDENPQAVPQVGVVGQRAKASGKSMVTQVGRDQITVRPERRS